MAGLLVPTVQAGSFMNVANGVWSTGVSSGGTQLPSSNFGVVDPHYRLAQIPDGCSGTNCLDDYFTAFGPETFVVMGPAGTYPLDGTWLANNANSLWIGPRSNQTNPSLPFNEIYASSTSPYVYRQVFDLTALGLNPATASILLGWLSDNNSAFGLSFSQIRLCSVASITDPVCSSLSTVTGSTNAGEGAASLTSVSLTNGVNGVTFSAGLMALDFVVYNQYIFSGANPSGLRVEIVSATADAADNPVPEPATMVLIGAGLIGLGALRRHHRR